MNFRNRNKIITISKFHYFLQKSVINDDDLISFDDEENHTKKTIVIKKCVGDSSPEY